MKTASFSLPPPSPGLLDRIAEALKNLTSDSPALLHRLAAQMGLKAMPMAAGPADASESPPRPAKTLLVEPAAVAPRLAARTLQQMKDEILAAHGDYPGFVRYSASLDSDADRVVFAAAVARNLAAAKVKQRTTAKQQLPASVIWSLTRSQFEQLTPADKSEWLRCGGKLKDG